MSILLVHAYRQRSFCLFRADIAQPTISPREQRNELTNWYTLLHVLSVSDDL